MKKIKVVSRRYDGSLREEYEAFLHAEDDETITVYSPPGTLAHDHRKGASIPSPDGLLEIYFKHKWYIVWHVCEQISNRNLIYAHVAMDTKFTGKRLEWIDLDLDYRVHMDGSLEALDIDEFERNALALPYPAHVVAQAKAACGELEQLYLAKAFPFNHQEQVELYRGIQAKTTGSKRDA